MPQGLASARTTMSGMVPSASSLPASPMSRSGQAPAVSVPQVAISMAQCAWIVSMGNNGTLESSSANVKEDGNGTASSARETTVAAQITESGTPLSRSVSVPVGTIGVGMLAFQFLLAEEVSSGTKIPSSATAPWAPSTTEPTVYTALLIRSGVRPL